MKIDFFEEFPEKDLKKAKLINFNSTIFIAAYSFKDFKKFKKELKNINPNLEAAYWPFLKESCWISPFSPTQELEKIIKDLKQNKQKKPLKILIDLELPFNKKLICKNLFSYFKNKKIIESIFKDAKKFNLDIYTAECAIFNRFTEIKLRLQGISYSLKKYPHKKIIMFYPSMVKDKTLIPILKKNIIKKFKEYKNNLKIALGVIATGTWKNEPILSPKNFEKEMKFLKKTGIDNVVIYRLGGLNRVYLKIIKKFT